VLAVVGAVAGAEYNVLDQLNSSSRIPDSLGDRSLQGLVALVGVVVVAIVGSILGGLGGMHFDREFDKVGLGRWVRQPGAPPDVRGGRDRTRGPVTVW